VVAGLTYNFEFGAENRAEGWNAWLTLAISPMSPHTPETSAKQSGLITKARP
jgi:hypothetical protein